MNLNLYLITDKFGLKDPSLLFKFFFLIKIIY